MNEKNLKNNYNIVLILSEDSPLTKELSKWPENGFAASIKTPSFNPDSYEDHYWECLDNNFRFWVDGIELDEFLQIVKELLLGEVEFIPEEL